MDNLCILRSLMILHDFCSINLRFGREVFQKRFVALKNQLNGIRFVGRNGYEIGAIETTKKSLTMKRFLSNKNNDDAAIDSLNAFINAVEAQRGKEITETEAEELISKVQAIIDLLSQ